MADLTASVKEQQLGSIAGSKTLLSASDFSYLGHYQVPYMIGDPEWGAALTHRYVGGELRFLSLQYMGAGTNQQRLVEYRLPASYSQAVIQTQNWSGADLGGGLKLEDNWSTPLSQAWCGLWWEEEQQRLWTSTSLDYPQQESQKTWTLALMTRSLGSGTISNPKGIWGLANVGCRTLAGGGVQAVPAWFQSQYNVGPYVVGWGGYTSLMAQGLGPSLGLSMFAIPDPTDYLQGNISENEYKVLADYRSGTVMSTDWYTSGAPTTFDRGKRFTTNYQSWFDIVPAHLPPSYPADPLGPWNATPNGDGGRYLYGDTYANTGCWIDTPTKHGFIVVGTFGTGKGWYQGSTTYWDAATYELHIFNPAHLGEVAQGMRNPWMAQPIDGLELTGLPYVGVSRGSSTGHVNAIGGATFDSISNRLYMLYYDFVRRTSWLFVYQVTL